MTSEMDEHIIIIGSRCDYQLLRGLQMIPMSWHLVVRRWGNIETLFVMKQMKTSLQTVTGRILIRRLLSCPFHA